MPSDLRIGQRGIIKIFIFCNFRFERNIFTHRIAAAIQKQRCEQSAHSAVAVVKRMNTQEVVNENRNENERIHVAFGNSTVELLANLVNGRRCFIGGKRCENRVLFSICVYAADIVLHVLKLTADTFTRMTVKDFMQLQEIVGGNGNIFITFVYDVQNVPVTGNFFFVTCSGRCLFGQKLFKPCIGSADAFDFVGSFGTLYLCNLHELFKFLRLLPDIQVLFAFHFVNSGNICNDFRIPLLIFKGNVIKSAHSVSPKTILFS